MKKTKPIRRLLAASSIAGNAAVAFGCDSGPSRSDDDLNKQSDACAGAAAVAAAADARAEAAPAPEARAAEVAARAEAGSGSDGMRSVADFGSASPADAGAAGAIGRLRGAFGATRP